MFRCSELRRLNTDTLTPTFQVIHAAARWMPQIEADARRQTDGQTGQKMGEKGGAQSLFRSLPLDTLKAEQRGNLWSLGQGDFLKLGRPVNK